MTSRPSAVCEPVPLPAAGGRRHVEALAFALAEEKWHRRMGRGSRASSWNRSHATAPRTQQAA